MSIKDPLISIGLLTYNRPDEFRRMLVSLVNQTYVNLEIVISDNCSPEERTGQIAQEFMQRDSRIKYFRQDRNIGAYRNFLFVLEQAKGDYFAWACDDDVRDPRFVEACVQAFERSPDLIVVNSYSKLVDKQTSRIVAIDKGCTTIGLSTPNRYIKFLSTIYTEQAAVVDILYGLIKREALVNTIQDIPNILGFDHVMLACLALKGEFYTVPEILMQSTTSGVSATLASHINAQKIQGSRSEKMPVWVREIQNQRNIRNAAHLSHFEKMSLSLWSCWYYLSTHGLKMWVKSNFPHLFQFLKQSRQTLKSSTILKGFVKAAYFVIHISDERC